MIIGLIKIHFKFLIITPHFHGYSNNEHTVSKAHLLYQRITIDFSDLAM